MAKAAKAKHLQARVTFLDQAAKLLASRSVPETASQSSVGSSTPAKGLPLLLSAHMRTVAKRSQIRLSGDVKASICKTCCTPLLHGNTSSTYTENASKGAKKPWADVSIVECLNCGTKKRFPIGATRQKKRKLRSEANTIVESTLPANSDAPLDAQDVPKG